MNRTADRFVRLWLFVTGAGLAACSGGGGTGPAPMPASSPVPVMTATPTPHPTSTPTPPPATTSSNNVAFMSPGPTLDSYRGIVAPTSQYGIVDSISTAQITTTSASNAAIATDPVSVTLSTSASTFSYAQRSATQSRRMVPLGTLRRGLVETPVGSIAEHRGVDDSAIVRALVALPHRAPPAGVQRLASVRVSSIPTTVGGSSSFFVSTASIGSAGLTYTSVPATLQAVSTHGYIWIDNTLALSATSIARIAADFDNAYASDVAHFGTPEFSSTSPLSLVYTQPCDASTGVPIPGASPVPLLIPPPNGMHVLLVINSNALGSGVGGYFTGLNHFTQAAANCTKGAKSNERSMIVVGYDPSGSDAYELDEDLVRGTAHEFQHLINFANHVILSTNPQLEDTWINEGLSMLSQDFAIDRLHPGQGIDAADALNLAHLFLNNPQNYSLTGFTGVDPGKSTLAYNCAGCYGASYLFQRYLYDHFGGDTYAQHMESGGTVSFAGLQAQTGSDVATLVKNFSVALAVSGTGLSTQPEFNFTGFNPYGSYTDQFGTVSKLAGPGVTIASTGSSTSYAPYLGSFFYIQTQPPAGTGTGVTVTDTGGAFNLSSALIQF